MVSLINVSACAEPNLTHASGQGQRFWIRVRQIALSPYLFVPDLPNSISNALADATGDPVDDLYAQNTTVALGEGEGLRQLYEFGLYSFCAYINITGDMQGNCSNHTTAQRFQPYAIALADMPSKFASLSQSFIPQDLTFTNSRYLGEFSHAAYYLLLLGSICAALAMLTSVITFVHLPPALTAFIQWNPQKDVHVPALHSFRHSWHGLTVYRLCYLDCHHQQGEVYQRRSGKYLEIPILERI